MVAFIPRAAAAQGEPLGPEFRVNTYTTKSQEYPAVASDSSGNFVVVWDSRDQDGAGWGVFGQRYDSSGAPLGPEFRVNTHTVSFNQRQASVASDSSGNFVVVWRSNGDGSLLGVFGQRYASTGAPLGPEFLVNTYTMFRQDNPAVASSASGNFVVAWRSVTQEFGSNGTVLGQRYAGSGALLGPEFRVNTYTTDRKNYPAVSSDSSGNFVVVWESLDQDGYDDIIGQRYASTGEPLGPEFRVNTYTTQYQQYPAVASDSSGNFVVVWESFRQDGSYEGIFGQRYASTGAPLGAEFRVNTYTTTSHMSPAVSSDSSGNFVVIWDTYGLDGWDWGLFGQRFDSTGAPLGPEFRVNTHTTGSQYQPAVASDSSGNFVVVWHGFAQDGSGYGVFGQRYNMIVPVELMHVGVE